jgi:hypothetical protein
LIDSKGNKVVAPFGDTTYAVSLRTPLASRQLGTLDLGVDFGSCTSVDTAAAVFTAAVTSEANKAFPAGGQVALRGNGSSVDIGFNSFVVDIPLTASVPNWFDADVERVARVQCVVAQRSGPRYPRLRQDERVVWRGLRDPLGRLLRRGRGRTRRPIP